MKEKLFSLLSEVFEIKEINISMEMTKDDIDYWDSLRQMDLVVSIEKEFEITLEIDDIVAMNSIQAIFEVLERKIGK